MVTHEPAHNWIIDLIKSTLITPSPHAAASISLTQWCHCLTSALHSSSHPQPLSHHTTQLIHTHRKLDSHPSFSKITSIVTYTTLSLSLDGFSVNVMINQAQAGLWLRFWIWKQILTFSLSVRVEFNYHAYLFGSFKYFRGCGQVELYVWGWWRILWSGLNNRSTQTTFRSTSLQSNQWFQRCLFSSGGHVIKPIGPFWLEISPLDLTYPTHEHPKEPGGGRKPW